MVKKNKNIEFERKMPPRKSKRKKIRRRRKFSKTAESSSQMEEDSDSFTSTHPQKEDQIEEEIIKESVTDLVKKIKIIWKTIIVLFIIILFSNIYYLTFVNSLTRVLNMMDSEYNMALEMATQYVEHEHGIKKERANTFKNLLAIERPIWAQVEDMKGDDEDDDDPGVYALLPEYLKIRRMEIFINDRRKLEEMAKETSLKFQHSSLIAFRHDNGSFLQKEQIPKLGDFGLAENGKVFFVLIFFRDCACDEG